METFKRSTRNLKEIQEPLKFSNIEPLEVIEPYSPQVIQFESIEDFNGYYSKHQNEFNGTTQKLNKKYKIPGYKLTTLKGQLKIIKDYRADSVHEPELYHESDYEKKQNELTQRIIKIEKLQELIQQQIKQIQDFLEAFQSV